MIRRGIGLVLAVLIGLAWVSSATAQDARSVPERTLEIRRYHHRQTEFAEGLFGEHAWRITWWIRTNAPAHDPESEVVSVEVVVDSARQWGRFTDAATGLEPVLAPTRLLTGLAGVSVRVEFGPGGNMAVVPASDVPEEDLDLLRGPWSGFYPLLARWSSALDGAFADTLRYAQASLGGSEGRLERYAPEASAPVFSYEYEEFGSGAGQGELSIPPMRGAGRIELDPAGRVNYREEWGEAAGPDTVAGFGPVESFGVMRAIVVGPDRVAPPFPIDSVVGSRVTPETDLSRLVGSWELEAPGFEGARQILEIGSDGLCEWWIGGEQSFAYRLAADTLHVSVHDSEGEPQPVASVLLIKAGNVIRVHYLDDSQPDREMASIGGAPGGESYLEGIWKTLQPGPVERTEEFRADGTLITRTKRDLGSCRVENGLLSIDFAELDQAPSRAVHIAGEILVLSAPPWTGRRFRRIEQE